MIFIFTDPDNGNEIIIAKNKVRVELGNGFSEGGGQTRPRPNNQVWINGSSLFDPNKTSPEKAKAVFDEITTAMLNGNIAIDLRYLAEEEKAKEDEKKNVPPPHQVKIREKRVKDLSPQQCRDLMVHAHVCSKERRKAYLLKGYGNEGQVYFTPVEESLIWINIENGI